MTMLNALTLNLQNLADLWNQFFHAPESALALAVFRVAFGVLLLGNAFSLWRSAEFCLYPEGALALEYQRTAFKKTTWSLFNHLPPTRGAVHFVLLSHLVGVIGLLFGFYTQPSAALVFITLISLHSRNFYMLNSGDTLQRLLSFFLIFSQAGGALSVDAWLAGISETATDPWALRLMQALVAIVYLRTTYWKLRGATWRAGSATYYALSLRDYRRRKLPQWLARSWFYRATTYGTLALEGALGALLWFDPLRYSLLLAGLALHLGLQYFMRTGLFQWTMLTSLLLFIKPADLHEWLKPLCLFR
ncbi:MAG TPA: HTTM domain-containing protein [Blastocatellia bacterium]|nr:HTTM domain-containing protein [Blastocatellia bacterium]